MMPRRSNKPSLVSQIASGKLCGRYVRGSVLLGCFVSLGLILVSV